MWRITRSEINNNYLILEDKGEDAAKERYLTFVAQILNICQRQVHQSPDLQPLLLIFLFFSPRKEEIDVPTKIKTNLEAKE